MCQVDWDIIQKFVATLIWPAILITILMIFRKQIIQLVNRITNESNQIELGGLLKTTFRDVQELRDAVDERTQEPTSQSLTTQTTQRIISTTTTLQIETIKSFGEEYIKSNYDQRRILEAKIKDFAVGLRPDDIRELFDSPSTGVKVAAAISLDAILSQRNFDPADISSVKEFIINSLRSNSSFLRYEALHLVLNSPKLTSELRRTLLQMATDDENSAIRSTLKLFLNQK